MAEQRYMKIADAAAYMGMSEKTVRACIDSKPECIPPFSVLANPTGKYRTIRFDKVDIDRWMEMRKNRTESSGLTEV